MEAKLKKSVIDKIFELKHLCYIKFSYDNVIEKILDNKYKENFNDHIDRFIKSYDDKEIILTKQYTMGFLIDLLSSYILHKNINITPIVNLLHDINKGYYDTDEYLDIDINDCK